MLILNASPTATDVQTILFSDTVLKVKILISFFLLFFFLSCSQLFFSIDLSVNSYMRSGKDPKTMLHNLQRNYYISFLLKVIFEKSFFFK